MATNQSRSRGIHPVGALTRPHRKFREETYQEGLVGDSDLADQAVRKVLDLVNHHAEPVVGGHWELVQLAGLDESRIGIRVHCAPGVFLLEFIHQVHTLGRDCRAHRQLGGQDSFSGRSGRRSCH